MSSYLSTTQPATDQAPTRARGHLRVAAIREAGAALFAEKGFDATTMTEIAARSGTAMASLYRFFPSKEALAEALLLQYAQHVLDGLEDLRARAGGMTAEALAAAIVDFSMAVQSRQQLAHGLADGRGVSEARLQLFRDEMRDHFARILQAGLPDLALDKAQAKAIILIGVFKQVRAVSRETPAWRDSLLAEAREMIRAYLAAAGWV